MLDQQKEVFREEALELLTDLEASLLKLEESPDDRELVAGVFRAMHTIKGSGAMFGFEAIAAFTHEVETVFDLVRNGEIPVTRELVNLSLSARDHILSLLRDSEQDGECDAGDGATLVEAFRGLLPATVAAGEGSGTSSAKLATQPKGECDTYRIRLKLPPDIILRGTRPEGLLRELNDLGSCRIIAQLDAIPLLENLDPTSCCVEWDVILTSDRGLDAIKDVFIFVEDDIELKIDTIDVGNDFDVSQDYKRVGELLVDRGDVRPEDLAEVIRAIKPLGQLLIDSKKVLPGKLAAALQEQEAVRAARSQRTPQSQDLETTTVRVPAERLDHLVNMVGELVTVQARLSRCAASSEDTDLASIAEEVERLSDELRECSLTMRMLPIGSTFNKFKRLVRDLAGDLDKEVDLRISGEETELDKTVIEKLNDPLVHLIRNSLDHGLESPERRTAVGKPRAGVLRLTAEHSGDSVIVTISDDGRGLDREAILAKAVDRGLVSAEAQPTENEIANLIFAPGFSTAKTVTGVSGRGVGMDVVKRAIESLRGTINIASEQGKGTTISIRLPLTLAIVESLLVKIGGDAFALPLSIVEECVELSREDVARAHGRHLVKTRGQLVPYIPLRRQFGMQGDPPAIEQIVITRVNGGQIGLVVDHVVGEHQSVIKSLGRMCKGVQGLSGATILGDGSVALILDVPHLARQAEQQA